MVGAAPVIACRIAADGATAWMWWPSYGADFFSAASFGNHFARSAFSTICC